MSEKETELTLTALLTFHLFKLTAQFVKLVYNLLVVNLDILAGEFIDCLLYLFADDGKGPTSLLINALRQMLTDC